MGYYSETGSFLFMENCDVLGSIQGVLRGSSNRVHKFTIRLFMINQQRPVRPERYSKGV